MRTVDQHLAAVLDLVEPLAAAKVPVAASAGRVLARNLPARFAVPPFDNSAMDGYAVRHADLEPIPTTLKVVGDIPAGTAASRVLGPGEAMRIMTGAPIPPGADAVVPVELTDQLAGDQPLPQQVVVTEAVDVGRHIRWCAENVKVGDVVLNRGDLATPAAAAAAVSVGHSHWELSARPRVAVIATGEELRDPGEDLGPGEIPDSNSLLLAGTAAQFGAEVVGTYRAPDDPQAFSRLLDSLPAVDALVTSGGVSAGAFEVVRQAAGAGMKFVQVAMQPGKPQGAGKWRVGGREVATLAFPGNPVSVFVSAWLFLRPMLHKLAGRDIADERSIQPAAANWRPPVGRTQYLPIVFTDQGVLPAHRMGSGSHAIGSLHLAQGLAIVPAEIEAVEIGRELEVIDIRGA